MKRSGFITIAIAVLAAVLYFVFFTHPHAMGKNAGKIVENIENDSFHAPDINGLLASIADAVNKVLPEKVDILTRLDKIQAEPNKKISMFYTVLAHAKLLTDSPSQFGKEKLEGPAIETACGDPLIRKLLERGVTANFKYASDDNVPLVNVTITLADCKNAH